MENAPASDQEGYVIRLSPDSPKRSQFYLILDSFLIKLESLEESLAVSIPAIAEAHESQVRDQQKKLNDLLASIGSTNKARLEQIINERSLELSRIIHMVQKSSVAPVPATILNSLYIYIFSLYDALINDLMHLIISHKPHLVNEKPLNLGEIMSFGSIEKAKQYLIDKEVEKFVRKSYVEQFDYLESKLEMPLRKNLLSWPSFIEASQRRHLFVHASGRVSQQYVDECTTVGYKWSNGIPSVGDSLKITVDDVKRASALCHEIGFKLAQTLFRKVVPAELNVADTILTSHMYELNVSEQWDKSILVGEFAMGMPVSAISNDASYRTMVINLAQAYKWNGESAKAQKVIDQKDWSSCGDQYHLVLAVLKDDYASAARYMKIIGSSSYMSKGDYLDWPIFREFRNQSEFLNAYEEVYKEPFAASLLHIVEGRSEAFKRKVSVDISPLLTHSSKDQRN